MTSMKIQDRSDAHEKQLEYIELPRSLMGGTAAMRKAGEKYLPKKLMESIANYQDRRDGGALDNYLAKTVNYLAGQVFQKEVDYQDAQAKGAREYDTVFFDRFKENVDLAGDGLSVFGQKLLRGGLIDGVSFVLVDHSRVNTRTENGVLEYESAPGVWEPKTVEADQKNGWQPYFVLIRADQVLDAWLDNVNGRQVLRHFRYEERGQAANDARGLDREEVARVRAWWPEKWEVWESRAKKEPELIDEGPNALGYIPLFWFMPGEDRGELTAQSPLADLAEWNRVHWRAYANHAAEMEWMRLFVWVGQNLRDGKGDALSFGPNTIFNIRTGGGEVCDLKAVSPPVENISASLADLANIEDRMKAYGLQMAFAPQSAAGVTATEAGIAAAASDSQLKGWCVLLKDCLENALKAVANYQGDDDGPAVFVNTEFRAVVDVAVVSMLSGLVDKGQFPVEGLWSVMKAMGLITDDMTVDQIKKLLDKALEKAPAPKMAGAFGGFEE